MLNKKLSFLAILAAVLFAACGDSSTERIVDDRLVVTNVAELPACDVSNEGEQILVKDEGSVRVCADNKWFSTVGDTLYEQSGKLLCKTEKLADSSGIKIICNGDSVGVVYNGTDGAKGEDGADGAPGQQGPQGFKGLQGADGAEGVKGEKGSDGVEGNAGADGASCTLKTVDELSVRVYCGKDSVTLYIGEMPDTSSVGIELDSEKVAISLDEMSGASQKGPFLSGSKVRAFELQDGRTLKQTGNIFNGKIMNDNGEFKINARTLMSQYLALEATGFYRNEVTGKNSNSELTLFAITDVSARSVANMNLLTHLEYERVNYLVTKEKMKVKAAKKKAQREVFRILGIDATDFSNSEDLNIAGSSDEDGALLAFSVMLQGDRSVAELTELLTRISTDMEKDSTWDDATTRMKIAEWSADADSAGRLAVIRNNVKNWRLSEMVPNFEKYIRHFWYTEYGLGECTADSADTVKAATAGKRKGTKTRYICKADSVGEFHWEVASDYEKDTYLWEPGGDAELKAGAVTGVYYLYDAVKASWRIATVVEQTLGGCSETIASDDSRNTARFNGYMYKCENHNWVRYSNFVENVQDWVPGTDGDLKNVDGAYSVFDEAEGGWRDASVLDYTLGLNGCTTNRVGEMGMAATDYKYYRCESDHQWTVITDKAVYNMAGIECMEDGVFMKGLVDTRSYFVCDAGVWREATVVEEQLGEACTIAKNGMFNSDSTRVCEKGDFRYATLYDFEVGQKKYLNPDIEYGELYDKRDGRTYKTIVINGFNIMAENLNYADEGENPYLINNNWCYHDDTTNCLKGGRFYTWTAAMDIDPKWQNTDLPEGVIKKQHRGICPQGWHVLGIDEWESISPGFWDHDYSEDFYPHHQAVGFPRWGNATNESGLSILPVGYRRNFLNHDCDDGDYSDDPWCATVGLKTYLCTVPGDDWHWRNICFGPSSSCLYDSSGSDDDGLSVRCVQDYPEE